MLRPLSRHKAQGGDRSRVTQLTGRGPAQISVVHLALLCYVVQLQFRLSTDEDTSENTALPSRLLSSSAVLFVTGNYGKVEEVRRAKKSQSKEELRRSREDLNEEVQGLLESEEELDREELLSPEPDKKSVSAPMRPEPTEYDR